MLRILQNSFSRLNISMQSQIKFFKSETGEHTANGSKIFRNWKIVKGDNVIVNSGKDKNKTGIVTKVYRNRNQVVVQGINQKNKQMTLEMQEQQEIQGAKIKFHPIDISNVNLIDPVTLKACRVKIGYTEDGQKVRISKKSGTIIDKPNRDEHKFKNRIKDKVDGMKDTPADSVLEVTYKGENFDKIKKEFEDFMKNKEKREKLLVFDE